MKRQQIINGNPLERTGGFCRAVRVGPFVTVGGTAPIDRGGNTVGIGDPVAQARQCFEIIEAALFAAGAEMDDIVRTRIMLTDINVWKDVAAVRKEYFQQNAPVDTVVEVQRFLDPDWLVEIEADAIVSDDSHGAAGHDTGRRLNG